VRLAARARPSTAGKTRGRVLVCAGQARAGGTGLAAGRFVAARSRASYRENRTRGGDVWCASPRMARRGRLVTSDGTAVRKESFWPAVRLRAARAQCIGPQRWRLSPVQREVVRS
jgi:hypothetical protein